MSRIKGLRPPGGLRVHRRFVSVPSDRFDFLPFFIAFVPGSERERERTWGEGRRRENKRENEEGKKVGRGKQKSNDRNLRIRLNIT